jgi:hypothetical protein
VLFVLNKGLIMEASVVPILADWAAFYVIVGTSAAVLTALQFIVVTLGAERSSGAAEANRAFGTPNIVHFCAVLLIAGLVSAPWPALGGVALVLGLCGVAGLVYAAVILRVVRRQTVYTPVLEDWVWHFTLPPIAYAALLIAAIMMQGNPELSLFIVGAAAVLLLFIGIHNSWDSATFIALQQREKREDS